MEIPKHWKEWTRTAVVDPKPEATLALISYMLGEAITEDISRGAREFTIEIHENRIIIACNKAGLETPTGYNPEKLYRDLFR